MCCSRIPYIHPGRVPHASPVFVAGIHSPIDPPIPRLSHEQDLFKYGSRIIIQTRGSPAPKDLSIIVAFKYICSPPPRYTPTPTPTRQPGQNVVQSSILSYLLNENESLRRHSQLPPSLGRHTPPPPPPPPSPLTDAALVGHLPFNPAKCRNTHTHDPDVGRYVR